MVQRLGVYSLGLWRNRPLAAALRGLGWQVVFGPTSNRLDAIAVWGASPVADRGLRAAKRRGCPVLYLEDAPFRGVTAGRNEPLMGLCLDTRAPHFDSTRPSDLEILLNSADLLNEQDIGRARDTLDLIGRLGLSKYNDPEHGHAPLPDEFVLVADQLPGDASISGGLADATRFAEMLEAARDENPGADILIARHPRAAHDPRRTHFADDLARGRVGFLPGHLRAVDVLPKAAKVYCVTSQLGFDAICRGHRPHVFGMPFYAGWGLSDDRQSLPRRARSHSVDSLCATIFLHYAKWFDPTRGLVEAPFETALHDLAARRDAARKTRPLAGFGMSRWKHRRLRQFLGPIRFCTDPARAPALARTHEIAVWASKTDLAATLSKGGQPVTRIEDGFLRSSGLGAALTPALSLCRDDIGIYFDPGAPSRLEHLIAQSVCLSPAQHRRAARLQAEIVALGISKYNLQPGRTANVRSGAILVPGQVEDDASIRLGTGPIATNAAMLRHVRACCPDAPLLYKPHPDVVAGLRAGHVSDAVLAACAAEPVADTDPIAALGAVAEVWTMTSLIGFEALLRGLQVTCLGLPFYAGWGLTRDHMPPPARRQVVGVTLTGLIHAALIDYPIYRAPGRSMAMSPETTLRHLSEMPGQAGTKARLRLQVQHHFSPTARGARR